MQSTEVAPDMMHLVTISLIHTYMKLTIIFITAAMSGKYIVCCPRRDVPGLPYMTSVSA